MHLSLPLSPLSFSKNCALLALCAAVCLLLPGRLHAGPPDTVTSKDATASTSLTEPDPIFHHGALDLQLMGGALFSVQARGTPERPNLDYAPIVLRLGYMVNNVYGSGFLRGNDEVMLEGIGAPIFSGPGSGLGGLSLLYRRNFLAPNTKIVPYVTFGAGGVYNDVYHEHPQRIIGAAGEFDLQAAAGLRFRVSTKLTLDTEFSYRHISNADFANRNYGTNGLGGMVGLSYGF